MDRPEVMNASSVALKSSRIRTPLGNDDASKSGPHLIFTVSNPAGASAPGQ